MVITDLTSLTGEQLRDYAAHVLNMTVHGSIEQLAAIVSPLATNRESVAEPPAARVTGPAAFAATGDWLRAAYSEMVFTVDEAVYADDLLVTHGTMSGRHTGPFVVYDASGQVERAFAPTGRSFSVTHTHWMRFADGLLIEHWANRDDQGQALQLGWVPPTPVYLWRCARATAKARRAS